MREVGEKNPVVVKLSRDLHCGYGLAEDLYRLGDQDFKHIVELSRKLKGVELVKMKLLLERLESIDDDLESLWIAVNGVVNGD